MVSSLRSHSVIHLPSLLHKLYLAGIATVFLLILLTLPLPSVASAALKGDANNDGKIDSSDIGSIISQVLGISTAPGSPDCNLDGSVDVRDVICVINTITSNNGSIPPDPVDVAPPVDNTVATNLFNATEFLYTGNNLIQTGVASGTIEVRRVAVLRGKVLTRDGTPLVGVKVNVLNHPEYGQTLSRANGMFDLAVNGGGLLTLQYAIAGYLPAQRQANVPWQDYVPMPDVILIPLDPQVTTINLSAGTMQVAQGSAMTDADGTRRATLLFPPNTQAQMVMPDGSLQTVTTLSVRATEYTVGPNGPQSMPADLPPASLYTYAVELSADEALIAGAATVRFSQPVPFYVENFLNFPIGVFVPVGFYDRNRGLWVASEDGRVIKILSITNGLADLDLDGDGAADSATALSGLGITDAERQNLANLYIPGQSLWRAPIPHFSPCDLNMRGGPPPDSCSPAGCAGGGGGGPGPKPDNRPKGDDDPCKKGGSIIECQTQTLGEEISVIGTPFNLHYQSNRVQGWRSANNLLIRLSGSTIPASLLRIHLEVHVAGQLFSQSFAPSANLFYSFRWDGKDAYGRRMEGKQPITVRIGYEYNMQYVVTGMRSSIALSSFGLPLGVGGAIGSFYTIPVSRPMPPQVILWNEWHDTIGGIIRSGLLGGGWSLSVHHVYDPTGGVLYKGDGGTRSSNFLSLVMATAAGENEPCMYASSLPCGDGGPATSAQLLAPIAVATGPDGSLYIGDATARVRRVGPDGIISTVVGNGNPGCGVNGDISICGDGGPAIQAGLGVIEALALGPDGSLFISDINRIRRVGPDGIINTIAGSTYGFSGDGGPAAQAQLSVTIGLAVAPDGGLYIADAGNLRVRRIGPDGIIATVAGSGQSCFFSDACGDGGQATLAKLSGPWGLAVGPEGSLYIADSANNRVRRVTQDGIITTVAGSLNIMGGFSGDGGQATAARFNEIRGIVVGPDGNLFIADNYNSRVRRVTPDGIVTTVAGSGWNRFGGDNGPATQGDMQSPSAVALGSDGSLYIADRGNNRIRRVTPTLPGGSLSDLFIASEDGSELYQFSGSGRHLRTLNALTGDIRYQFTYDTAGLLAAVVDGNGNVTTIERDASETPVAIIAPGGQRTTLTVNGDGYLSSITNPAGEAVQLTYDTGDAEGLLATLTDPRNNIHSFTYDSLGHLIRDEDPAGGATTLVRTDLSDTHYTVSLTTAAGLTTTYEVEDLPTGDTRRLSIAPSGAHTESLIHTDGSRQVTYPDGTVANLVEGPDPRFGMQSPLIKSLTVTTPGGRSSTRSASRAVSLSDPGNLFSLTSQTDTLTINGQTYTSTFDAATQQIKTTSPVGRQFVTTLDAQGRIVEQQSDPSLGTAPVRYTYDTQGRLTRIQQETQFWDFSYDAHDRLNARTDASGSRVTYAYDAADRITQTTLPGAGSYGFVYDANGNTTQVIMPNSGVHLLDYTPIDLMAGYTPPGNPGYIASYDTDRRLNHVVLPGGRTETLSFDSGNRPTGISYPEVAVVVAYAAGDPSARPEHITRTPTGSGTPQDVSFTYDGDLLTGTTWSGAANGQYTYAYDSNFLLNSMSLTSGPDTVTTNLTRDNDGLPTGLGPFAFTRSSSGGMATQISDGTLTVALAYDALGRVVSRTHTVAGHQVYAVEFTFDSVGRISRKVETIAGLSHTYDYSYDADSQLSTVAGDGAVMETYTYDPNHNRTSRQLGASPKETATYDAQDRLIQQGGEIYQFDVDGYLTQLGSDAFQFSTTGELLEASVGGQTVTYTYDGFRRRASRTDAMGTSQYLYGNPDNDLQVTNTRDPAGTLTTYYYDDGGRLFALQRGSARYYVVSDQLGSPRVVSDTTGAFVKVLEYDAFGNVTQDSNPGFDLPIGFAGGLNDDLTGFVRFGLRDYDPAAGRWTARDQSVFNGNQANLYAYVNNNPVNLVDPSGLVSLGTTVCDLFCVGLKLSYTSEGISACVEGGFGAGSNLEFDPFADLDKNGVSLEGKFAGKLGGIVKSEVGFELGECGQFKPKGEACVGPFCAKVGKTEELGKDLLKPKIKGSIEGEAGKVKGKNPFEAGLSGRFVGKVCQQAKW